MGEQTFLGKFIGAGGFHMGTNDQIMQGGEQVSQIFQKLYTVNLKIFPSHGGRHTWKYILTSL